MRRDPSQFTGCLLGLATGDALGAPHEGGLLERLVWRLIGRTRQGHLRWTDDTQMAVDLAESLLAHNGVDQDDLARRFAASYVWSRGYGTGTASVLQRVRRGHGWAAASRAVYPEGSYGNGAAMRSPVLALFFVGDADAMVAAARSSAAVTHAHPLGIEGALLISVATQALLHGAPTAEVFSAIRSHCRALNVLTKLELAEGWLASGALPAPRMVVHALGNGTTVDASCVTALYLALRHLEAPFEAMMEFAIAGGGDVDTIGAMAGALWGVARGAERLPAVALEERAALEALALRLVAHAERGRSL